MARAKDSLVLITQFGYLKVDMRLGINHVDAALVASWRT